MIPEIRFESEQNGVAWKADDGHVGLEFVDRVRRELDEPELPLNKIDDFVRHDWARYVSVELTEERARGLVGRYLSRHPPDGGWRRTTMPSSSPAARIDDSLLIHIV